MKNKFVTKDEIVNDVYNELRISGYGISKSTIEKIISTSDDIRKNRFIEGEVVDLGFCSIESKVRRVNNNIGNTEGFTIKVQGTLYKTYRDQCITREKSLREENNK